MKDRVTDQRCSSPDGVGGAARRIGGKQRHADEAQDGATQEDRHQPETTSISGTQAANKEQGGTGKAQGGQIQHCRPCPRPGPDVVADGLSDRVHPVA